MKLYFNKHMSLIKYSLTMCHKAYIIYACSIIVRRLCLHVRDCMRVQVLLGLYKADLYKVYKRGKEYEVI